MRPQTHRSPTDHLTELLAITRAADEDGAIRAALERAADTLGCGIGAVVRSGSVLHSVGADDETLASLIEAATSPAGRIALPDGSSATTSAVPLDQPDDLVLVLARPTEEPFEQDEVDALTGLARILGLTLTMIRTLASQRTREQLLEKSASIQNAITLRTPLQDVLELIAAAAGELLGDEVVGLRLIDPEQPDRMRTATSTGIEADLMWRTEHGHVGSGVGGRAIAENRLVVVDDYPAQPEALPELVERGLQAAMAAPIHDGEEAIGSLLVASLDPGRTYSQSDQDLLAAFARHASLALLDARTIDQLLSQALHDPLTALANRTLFLDRLEHALTRAEREGLSVALLFIDLDRFKAVNDNFGHATGDALLIEVARRLQSLTRATDTVARFGGDEFAVLIEDAAEQAAAARVAAAAIDRLRKVFVLEGEEIFVTASIGIAFAHRRGEDPLRDADLAMYRAKSGGKDRYEFFATGMRAATLDRLELEGDLKQAIDRAAFVLHYQPIVDLANGSIGGLEALIRWQHPRRGLLPPAAFVPLAEVTGAIFSIGRWVLRKACRDAASWPLVGPDGEPPYVSVNLSPLQVQQLDLVEEIAEALRDSGLPAGRLMLEIGETALLDDSRASQTLRAVTGLGVRLAIDHFGTRSSSLQQLQRFPLDVLKIPREFVDQLSGGDGTLARATIDLGRTFGFAVIAEGIERPEQLERLRALGCTVGQGFLFGEPRDAETTRRLLAGEPAGPAAPGPERREAGEPGDPAAAIPGRRPA